MAFYNPHLTGQYFIPFCTINTQVFFSLLMWLVSNQARHHAGKSGNMHPAGCVYMCIPWKSKTKQRMVFGIIHVKDSFLPMGKVWSLDFLSIHNNAAKKNQYIAFIGSHLPKTHIQDKPTKKILQEQPKVGHGPHIYI